MYFKKLPLELADKDIQGLRFKIAKFNLIDKFKK